MNKQKYIANESPSTRLTTEPKRQSRSTPSVLDHIGGVDSGHSLNCHCMTFTSRPFVNLADVKLGTIPIAKAKYAEPLPDKTLTRRQRNSLRGKTFRRNVDASQASQHLDYKTQSAKSALDVSGTLTTKPSKLGAKLSRKKSNSVSAYARTGAIKRYFVPIVKG
jgi:hypothetical protein